MKIDWLTNKLDEVMGKQNTDNGSVKIPVVNRDGSLVSRLLPVALGGFDEVFDRESRLYLRLLVRLIDKSFGEYMTAREYVLEETKTKDKLAHRFNIISHLENCVNAINRATKILDALISGISINHKKLVKEYNILKFVCEETLKNVMNYRISQIRNRIEHIDEDIYKGEFKRDLFLDLDNNYRKICISGECLLLSDLTSTIENYHNFVLEIFSNLPKRWENGIFYYDKN